MDVYGISGDFNSTLKTIRYMMFSSPVVGMPFLLVINSDDCDMGGMASCSDPVECCRWYQGRGHGAGWHGAGGGHWPCPRARWRALARAARPRPRTGTAGHGGASGSSTAPGARASAGDRVAPAMSAADAARLQQTHGADVADARPRPCRLRVLPARLRPTHGADVAGTHGPGADEARPRRLRALGLVRPRQGPLGGFGKCG